MTAKIWKCPDCGGKNLSFDRSICACGLMHYYCGDCGSQEDPCTDAPELRASGGMSPMEKAAIIDKHAGTVLNVLWELLDGQQDSWNEILEVAKARHILGHYEYGDTNLFEWTDGKVRAAIIEELADAVVYQAWLEERASTKDAPVSVHHFATKEEQDAWMDEFKRRQERAET